ncbi:unnamed protein product [Caenorhabditis auriculariae]|uniref:Major facilitator superfamily (MFS) profile domain-containing protein n=1 Tax=Caenorhabditis auriculariae TaxID=2777116 RepID=A0A8S1HJ22_9PELO|nr:unnamed protein product [Caenorhabditis auriculariae]
MFWGDNYRLLVVLVGFFCLVSICSNHNVINFTFICMQDDFSDAVVDANGTMRSKFDYTPDEKSKILWALAVGTITGTMPVNYLYVRFGARYPFFIAGIISAISTVLVPEAAVLGFGPLVFLRFVQGVAYSADFAAIGLIVSRWAPLKETAIFIATLTSFTGISSIITNGLSGAICESSLGWRWSYYLHALGGVALFMAWVFVYSDDPADDARVSKRELSKIQKNKSSAHLENNCEVPYMKLLTSPVILCVWICAFVELSGTILITMYAPIYFRRALHFGIAETGFWLGAIIAVHIPLRFVAAVISDKLRCVSEMTKIHIFNSIAVGGVGIFFAIFGFIPSENKTAAVICLMLLECATSFNSGGFYKCGTLHARQFSHVVISAVQFTKCVALFTGPAIVSLFVTDESDRTQWQRVFFAYCAAMVLATILAYFFFTDKPAIWTEEVTVKKSEKSKVAPAV